MIIKASKTWFRNGNIKGTIKVNNFMIKQNCLKVLNLNSNKSSKQQNFLIMNNWMSNFFICSVSHNCHHFLTRYSLKSFLIPHLLNVFFCCYKFLRPFTPSCSIWYSTHPRWKESQDILHKKLHYLVFVDVKIDYILHTLSNKMWYLRLGQAVVFAY